MPNLDYYIYCFFERYSGRIPYFKYKKDKRNHFKNYTLFNFWYEANVKDSRLTRFIEFNNLNKNNKKVNFISVFGTRKVLKYIDGIKIFYTGEYIGEDRFLEYNDYCLDDVDLSIGFREYDNVNNYVRLPLWIIYLFEPEKTTLKDINEGIESLEKNKHNRVKRGKFCALISSHDDIELTRTNAYNEISKYGKIDCPGKLLHNIDVSIPRYQDKIDFLGKYKYNICPENKEDIGYVTEKLIDSWKAGCIPIYRGLFGELEKNVFNENCIVRLKDLNNNNISPEKESYFCQNRIFKKGSSEHIYSTIKQLESKLKSILS